MTQTYNSAPQRVGMVKGETLPAAKPGLIGARLGSAPAAPKNKVLVKEHYRTKAKANKSR